MRERPGWRRERRIRGENQHAIRQELEIHLEGRIEQFVSEGMSYEAAKDLALRRFGHMRAIETACMVESGGNSFFGENNTFGQVRKMVRSLLYDLKHTARGLARRPGYTTSILITLILAIGAVTAVFSVINETLLRPLPHPSPEELVMVYEVDARPGNYDDRNVVSGANFSDWREQNRVFESMASYNAFDFTLYPADEPLRVLGGTVTGNFFSIMGATPGLGRLIVADDDVAGNDDVIVLSHEFWRETFAGDSSILGTTLRVGSGSSTVIGVLPRDFVFLDRPVDIWMPAALTEEQLQNRRTHRLQIVARMRPGVTYDDAERDMERVVAGLRDRYPEFLTGWSVNVVPLMDQIMGSTRPALLVLAGAVVFVLLIAVVNVANLMLTRALSEDREFAVRSALGAGAGRLLQTKLLESMVLGLTASMAGLLVAFVGTKALVNLAPDTLPRTGEIGVDLRVFAFAVGLAVLTSLFVGLVPGIYAARSSLSGSLRAGGRGGTATKSHNRIRAGFVITQVTFSSMLLISAGLMINTFAHLLRVDPGFETGGVATMKVTLPGSDYPTVQDRAMMFDQIAAAAATLPGVEHSGLTRILPLDGVEWTWGVQVEGKPQRREGEKRDYGFHSVGPGYFQTVGTRLQAGRTFNDTDRRDAIRVGMVNDAFIRRFFDSRESPLGSRFHLLSRPDESIEIVGVVEDVRQYGLDVEPVPAFYMPYHQIPEEWPWFLGEMTVTFRTVGDPTQLMPALRERVRAIDGQILITDVTTMRDRVSGSVARTRFAMALLGVFAAIVLLLTLIGIYGVIAYTVSQHNKEIGVRIALGAQPGRIVTVFIKRGLALVAAGLGFGILGAAFLTRFQTSMLYGVTALDPVTYAIVTAVLIGVSLIAVIIPARKASRVDPMTALRED